MEEYSPLFGMTDKAVTGPMTASDPSTHRSHDGRTHGKKPASAKTLNINTHVCIEDDLKRWLTCSPSNISIAFPALQI